MVYSGFLEQKSSFVKGLPDTMPDSVKEILRKKYDGSMERFAQQTKIPYPKVYNVLVRAGQRPLETLKALSAPLGLTMDEMAQILLIRDLEKRKAVIDVLLAGRSQGQWGREAGLPASSVNSVVNNLEHTQLRNRVRIVKSLGLDLERFFTEYSS